VRQKSICGGKDTIMFCILQTRRQLKTSSSHPVRKVSTKIFYGHCFAA
jgi:hypothetical protein